MSGSLVSMARAGLPASKVQARTKAEMAGEMRMFENRVRMRQDSAAGGLRPLSRSWRFAGVNPPRRRRRVDVGQFAKPIQGWFPESAMPKIELYTSAHCAYCVAAKNLLKSKGLDYAEIRVDTDPARRDEMLARAHRRTVPQIFVNDRHVGGYEDLVAAERSGELTGLIGGGA